MKPLADYESAIRALNGLQSNAALLNKRRQRYQIHPEANVRETTQFLERTGITVSDLDRLNVIHVAGTKGKGSVCAMTEAILRNHGLKTGFYSSPHLIHVRERIRINGKPISEEKFASYFWHVYDRLSETEPPASDEDSLSSMPAYFKFLTLVSFHVFLAEKVDVAIVEVGIGGAYDCTNVLQHPVVCGVTTLDYDHMNVLGHTLEEIAWQKAGIMKPGSVAVAADQPQGALDVLYQRSSELKCPLFLCPELSSYPTEPSDPKLKLGIPGRQQFGNASVALQLARLWLARKENPAFLPEATQANDTSSMSQTLKPFPVTALLADALSKCRWPGRSQTLVHGKITFYLDGAHTPKSMVACADWFRDASLQSPNFHKDNIRMLIFNCTAGRQAESLLEHLADVDFDCAIFCPNMIDTTVDATSDQANMRTSHEKQMEICEENRKAWLSLHSGNENMHERNCHSGAVAAGDGTMVMSRLPNAARNLKMEFARAIEWSEYYPDASLGFTNFNEWTRSNGVCPSTKKVTAVFPCISSALGWLDSLNKTPEQIPGKNVEVLVTGSLHLVGGILGILNPGLKM